MDPPEWVPGRALRPLCHPFPQQKPATKGHVPGPPWKGLTILYSTSGTSFQRPADRDRAAQGLRGRLGTVSLGQRASAGHCLLSRPTGRGHLEPKGRTPESCKPDKQILEGSSPGTSSLNHRAPVWTRRAPTWQRQSAWPQQLHPFNALSSSDPFGPP